MPKKSNKSVQAAVAWQMRAKAGWGGRCLAHERTAWDIGAKYGWAINSAKSAMRQGYMHYEHWSKAPLGATLYWYPHGSKYGHVAGVTKTGKGCMIGSTDSQRSRTMVYPAGVFEKVGYKYIGWSTMVNDVVHAVGSGRPAGKPAKGKTQVFQISKAAIKQMQNVLGTTRDGKIDPKDSLVIRALQKKAGTTQDGYLSDPSEVGKQIQRYLNGLRDRKGRRYFSLNVDGHIDGPATTAALERYLLKLNGKFTNLHKA